MISIDPSYVLRERRVVSFGCSFVRGSHNDENPNRANRVGTPTLLALKQQYHINTSGYNNGLETCFTSELGELAKTSTNNLGIGGSGIRSAIYKALDYVENDKNASNSYVIIGISELSRFDFIRPSIKHKWPKLSMEEYAKYYDKEDVISEIRMLLKLTYTYFSEIDIPILFINTMNVNFSTKDIVPTFIFPNGSEYWRRYIESYDSSYAFEHPNVADHKHLARLLADKLLS
jgi:hypothetical protein|tara:strand:+ start:4593 stop:5288 length:696 start_codon:yes stop_codon:yes gene_type:complete